MDDAEYQAIVERLNGAADEARVRMHEGLGGAFRSEARRRTRVALAVVLMGEAGLRVGEVCGLMWGDLVMNGEPVRTVRVRGAIAKGGREREVPVSGVLGDGVRAAVDVVRVEEEYGREGWAWYLGRRVVPVTVREIQRAVSVITLRVLGRSVHPHAFRHYAGNRWRRVSDLFVVQRLLGHARIETTVLYTNVGGEDLRQAVDGATELVAGSVAGVMSVGE